MPHAYTSLHYHLIFATKHREPAITPDIRPRLWDYLGGIVRTAGGVAHAVGGVANHVHLLVTLRQRPAVSDVVRDLKAKSSAWVHETFPAATRLWWQTGYAAFTVSYSGRDAVRRYIEGQEEHHLARGFEPELRGFLRKHGIGYDDDGLGE